MSKAESDLVGFQVRDNTYTLAEYLSLVGKISAKKTPIQYVANKGRGAKKTRRYLVERMEGDEVYATCHDEVKIIPDMRGDVARGYVSAYVAKVGDSATDEAIEVAWVMVFAPGEGGKGNKEESVSLELDGDNQSVGVSSFSVTTRFEI